MKPIKYQICKRCVMDTSDQVISFNHEGVCDHCLNFELNIKPNWYPDVRGQIKIDSLVKRNHW